jgi:hypothetical protein
MRGTSWWPRCHDCGRRYDWRGAHACAEARAKCLNDNHDWIDITAVGHLERLLICARVGAPCTAAKRAPFEVRGKETRMR